jgi:hypothetical protein
MIRIFEYLKRMLRSVKQPQELFAQQQGLFFCASFPELPLRPNTLTLSQACSAGTDAKDPLLARIDAFEYRLTGHSKGHYSLAIVNRALAEALSRNSHQQASFVPFDNGHHDATLTKENHACGRPLVSIVHHYPVITDEALADLRLILFFWEETAVPPATISLLNEKFDAILVASSFVATALRNSGCAKPIFVIPLGLDHLVDFSEPLLPLTLGAHECFRFLHVSSVFERKGPEFLLSAFMRKFTADDPVELYIKTFPNPHNKIHEQLAELSANHPHAPRVIIDETELSKEALKALYRSSHTLVLPTRGEGFNLPAAEALALGLPLIVTGFGAHTDFCTTTTSSLIPYRFDLSQSHVNAGEGCWVTPEVRALGALMHQSVEEVRTHSESLHQRRVMGHTLMRTTYRWDQSVQGLANALHCLTTNPAFSHLTVQDLSLHDVRLSDANCLDLLVAHPQADAIVLKWEPSAQDARSLDAQILALRSLRTNDTVLILELSTTLDFSALKLDSTSVNAFLKLFDRIIVKNVDDLNKMLSVCKPSALMLLAEEAALLGSNDAQTQRNHRIKNMVKGLKFDLMLSKFSLQ